MTPGARIKAVIDALAELEIGNSPADSVLDRFFKGRRYMGAKDRRSVSARVYDVIRYRARIDWWLERSGRDRDSRLRVLAALVLGDGIPLADMQALFNGARHCPELLNEGEESLVRDLSGHDLDDPEQPEWIRFEYPQWLHEPLTRSLGDRLAVEIEALAVPACPDLRVNALIVNRDQARTALAAEGIVALPTPYSPWGLRVEGRARLGHVEAFRKGWVELQDEGSQLIALLTDAKPGMNVVDLCAGAGGKTLALAAKMANRGRLVACDVSFGRLRRMDNRLRRARVNCVEYRQVVEGDDAWMVDLSGGADRVLIDAPCTGTGAWRRRPDSKWRLTPEEYEGLIDVQSRLLSDASALVALGGRLVYATCSILASENEDQIERFLSEHRDFSLVPIERLWPDCADGDCPDTGTLRLSPARTQTDGFFVAVLERTTVR